MGVPSLGARCRRSQSIGGVMDLGTIGNVATALTVLVGVIFGMIELARARDERRERAAIEILHTMASPEYMHSVATIHELPDGLDWAAVNARGKDCLDCAQAMAMAFETLGYIVFRRMVPLEMADDMVGGAVRVAWRKLGAYFVEIRRISGSQKAWEWFEWLADRLEEHSGRLDNKKGAQIAYRNWRP